MQWTAASLGMIAAGLARAAVERSPKPLQILFLGGTGFIGPVQVEYALARGHRVTLFNRGRSAAGLFGDRAELLIGNRDARIDQGLSALAGERRWDVVIDNSGYIPRHVRDSVELLKHRVGRYVYVSTVAVYDPSGGTTLDESSPLRRMANPQDEELSWANYGPQKAECDRFVQESLGKAATIVRPTFIVGPGDETDRFTYWVDRLARGGDVLGPPEPKNELQWVDVRDLCPWIVTLAENDVPGVFNAAGPVTPMTWEQVLAALSSMAKEPVRLHWATAEVLKQLEIDLPLVFPGRGSRHFANTASQQAGLQYRPLAETATATLEWWRTQPESRRARVEGWPTPEKEREAISRLTVVAGRPLPGSP
jgi:2'-hydroxyisoflavone reductase